MPYSFHTMTSTKDTIRQLADILGTVLANMEEADVDTHTHGNYAVLGAEGVWKITHDPLNPVGRILHCHYTINGKHHDFSHDVSPSFSPSEAHEVVKALRENLAKHIADELLRGGERVIIEGLRP